jgi:spectinomycin phosphotransferase
VREQGTIYLLKAKSGTLYEPCCLVPRYLNDQGIVSVVAPLRTKNKNLWTQLGEWTVIVYPFLEGDSSLIGMTDEQWKEFGRIFHQIHQVILPAVGFDSLRKETFNPTNYAHWIHTFETQHVHSERGSHSERALHASWLVHQTIIHMLLASMEKLAVLLQGRSGLYVICHADLHARNLIRDRAGHVFVIDWDDVMLAPKERDFIFIREPQANAFWEGYGQKEIDWIALTYYRWERVVQDLIECARDICFRDDLGEASKDDLLQSFNMSFAKEQSNYAAAHAAAEHLPSDLTLHDKDISF